MPSHLALHGTSSTTTHKRQITGSPTAHARVADEVAGEYRAARLPSAECDDRTQSAEAASEARCGARGGAERRCVQLGAVGCTENDVGFSKRSPTQQLPSSSSQETSAGRAPGVSCVRERTWTLPPVSEHRRARPAAGPRRRAPSSASSLGSTLSPQAEAAPFAHANGAVYVPAATGALLQVD